MKFTRIFDYFYLIVKRAARILLSQKEYSAEIQSTDDIGYKFKTMNDSNSEKEKKIKESNKIEQNSHMDKKQQKIRSDNVQSDLMEQEEMKFENFGKKDENTEHIVVNSAVAKDSSVSVLSMINRFENITKTTQTNSKNQIIETKQPQPSVTNLVQRFNKINEEKSLKKSISNTKPSSYVVDLIKRFEQNLEKSTENGKRNCKDLSLLKSNKYNHVTNMVKYFENSQENSPIPRKNAQKSSQDLNSSPTETENTQNKVLSLINKFENKSSETTTVQQREVKITEQSPESIYSDLAEHEQIEQGLTADFEKSFNFSYIKALYETEIKNSNKYIPLPKEKMEFDIDFDSLKQFWEERKDICLRLFFGITYGSC